MAVYTQHPRRTIVEMAVVSVIVAVLLCLFMAALAVVWSRVLDAQCRSHLYGLFRATQQYVTENEDKGGWLPASDPNGHTWLAKLARHVGSPEMYICPKAPPALRRPGREPLSFGWNEHDCHSGTKLNRFAQRLASTVLLGDSLGSQPAGPLAHTLATPDGKLWLDLRHGGAGQVVYLDGHTELLSPTATPKRLEPFELQPQRPPDEAYHPLWLPWGHWVLVAACVAVPCVAAIGATCCIHRLQAARAGQVRQMKKAAERDAKKKAEDDYQAARKEFISQEVPTGPLEPLSLPRAQLRMGKQRLPVQPDRELMIGRSEYAHVRIPADRSVEREHAKIRPEGRGYVLYDLYSRAGTFVAGKRLKSKVLADGDSIRIGDTTLTFELRKHRA